MDILFWPLTVILLLTTFLAGIPFVYILPLELFGYRPTGWVEVLLGIFWLVVSIPLYYIFGFIGLLTLLIHKGFFKSDKSPNIILLLAATLLSLVIYFIFIGTIVWPVFDERQHLHNWPKDLKLTSFEVCTRDRSDSFLHSVTGHGLIIFQIENLSPSLLKEAIFTVKTGRAFVDRDFRLKIQNLRAGEKRTVVKEGYFGNVIGGNPEGGGPPGWIYANIYWDRVRFADAFPLTLESRPENARVVLGNCPRFSLIGTWQGEKGEMLNLEQVGDSIIGTVSGGSFSAYPNTITGSYDGKVFTGTFQHRIGRSSVSGTFSLSMTDGGQLQGSWKSEDGTEGTWLFERKEIKY